MILITTNALAGQEDLIGNWEGGDTASYAIYGVMNVNTKTISWKKNYNYPRNCNLRYQVQEEQGNIEFQDQIGNKHLTGNSKEPTYLLKVTQDNCSTGLGYVRFSFPLENDRSYMAFIEYDSNMQVQGLMHFHKK
ncbi:MAG TPA: hypothetical protein VK952_05720 [Methylotenera sp.]|nr:hypothetical protein [Methylotenera sp.]